jgi:NAD-dependent DNA ligase
LETLTQQIQALEQEKVKQAEKLETAIAQTQTLTPQLQALQQERDEMERGLTEASTVVDTLEQKVETLQKEKGQLAEAMKMAKDVVAFLEQQVKDLSQQKVNPPQTSPTAQAVAEPKPEPKPIAEAEADSSSASKASVAKPFEGKTFVITGKLLGLSFEQAKALIEAAGGQINEHPSSQTSYVVVGVNPGKKLNKAEKYGTPKLTETQLLELLEP